MVSIIIPFHNRKSLMERLFASLRQMSSSDVEMVFVDNNSDAETLDAVKAFAKELTAKDGVEVRIVSEQMPGAPAARNKGLDEAKGDYVYFFDSDDELSPDFINKARELAEATGADVVVAQIDMVMPNGAVVTKKLIRDTNPKHQIVANNLATQSLFLKRSFALEHGRWNEEIPYWNDLEWGFRVMLANPKVAWLSGTWHKIYKHGESITGNSFYEHTDHILLAHSIMQKDISEAQLPDADKKRLTHCLNCRKALYAGHVRKEGNAACAKRILDSILLTRVTLGNKMKYRILYCLSSVGVPGIWRFV